MSNQRSLSPTTQIWSARREVARKQATMLGMGLHVFDEAWQQNGKGEGRVYSGTFKDTTLKIFGSDEKLTIPVQTCTRVGDVKDAIAQAAMVDRGVIAIVIKQGCSSRQQLDLEEIGRNVTVRGVSSFRPSPYRWPHPRGIIGCGNHALKTCMAYIKEGNTDFVAFDRNAKAGGYCWLVCANKTSRLQTEFGSYHIWFGQDYVTDKCAYPADWPTWATKADIQRMYDHVVEQYGLLPHLHFNCEVAGVDFVGAKAWRDHDRSYVLNVDSLLPGGERSMHQCSVLYGFPGSMTRNRIVEYPGEEKFEGHIGYGMGDDIPFDHLPRSHTAVLGNGAFGVENIRTALDYNAEKVYMVTRRKNLASPRVPCWFVHQGPVPTPGRLVVEMFEPMYSVAKEWGNPWEYFGVIAPQSRASATISQGSRFGIGDVTFLAVAFGRCQYVEDTVKRMTSRTLHLERQKLEGVTVVIKALGLLGDHGFDRLMKMKELVGYFCSGDWRRPVLIDDPGMHASNFVTFSGGIGATQFARSHKFLYDYPKTWYQAQGDVMSQLATNRRSDATDKPAYVADSRHRMQAAIVMSTAVPSMDFANAGDGEYKYTMYHAAHPLDKFLQECVESWDAYQAKWNEQGFAHEYIPYPYTKGMVEGYFAEYSKAIGFHVSPHGPGEGHRPGLPEMAGLGQEPVWAQNEEAVQQMLGSKLDETKSYWTSQDRFLRRHVEGPRKPARRAAAPGG